MMATRHLLVFVVKLLLLRGTIPDGGESCNKMNLRFDNKSLCNNPSGYNITIPGTALCEQTLDRHNVLAILPGANFSGLTLHKNNISDRDIILILQGNNYQCVSLYPTKKGYCWNEGHNASTPEIKCNNISSSASSCKKFGDGDMTLTFNSTGCDECKQSSTGNAMAAASDALISYYKDEIGNAATVQFSATNITGLLKKLGNATAMSFGITTSGVTEILQGDGTQKDLFCAVEIPAEATDMARSQNSTLAAVMLFSSAEPPDNNGAFFNNKLLEIDLEANISSLTQPIKFLYSNVDKGEKIASCVSWNGEGKPNWTTDGCHVTEVGSNITCDCNHLTYFALLMSPPPLNISSSDYKALSYITSIGCGLSMLFLAVGLFMHCLIRKAKASQGTKILMHLFAAMFTLDLSFLVNESVANLDVYAACVAMAAVMHYAMLATISWFFVEALHLYYNIWRSPDEIKHYMVKTSVVGWGTPAIVVAVLLALQKYDRLVISISDGTTSKLCWIPDAFIQQGVNIGYYAVVFVFSFGIFIATLRQVVLFSPQEGKTQHRISIKPKSSSVLGLLFLLGITWAFAFFSYGPLLIPSYYIFTILNSFQGFFLFIYYYKTSKMPVDDRSLKAKDSTTCTSNLYS